MRPSVYKSALSRNLYSTIQNTLAVLNGCSIKFMFICCIVGINKLHNLSFLLFFFLPKIHPLAPNCKISPKIIFSETRIRTITCEFLNITETICKQMRCNLVQNLITRIWIPWAASARTSNC